MNTLFKWVYTVGDIVFKYNSAIDTINSNVSNGNVIWFGIDNAQFKLMVLFQI